MLGIEHRFSARVASALNTISPVFFFFWGGGSLIAQVDLELPT